MLVKAALLKFSEEYVLLRATDSESLGLSCIVPATVSTVHFFADNLSGTSVALIVEKCLSTFRY